jgi:hypothetical protein
MTTSSFTTYPTFCPTLLEHGSSTSHLPKSMIGRTSSRFLGGISRAHKCAPGNSWDFRSCRQKQDETLREYIRRFSKQCTEVPNITDSDVIGAFLVGTSCHDLVNKMGRKTPTNTSQLMDIATKFASGQEAVEAIFHKDKDSGKWKEDAPRRPPNATPRK